LSLCNVGEANQLPDCIFLVHDDLAFLRQCEAALRDSGYSVVAFDSSLTALERLQRTDLVEVLVTRTRFPAEHPDGIALANMARRVHPGIKIVLTAVPEVAQYVDGLGDILTAPVGPADVVDAVRRALSKEAPT
jgi:DNA-binding NtrC family response regulator